MFRAIARILARRAADKAFREYMAYQQICGTGLNTWRFERAYALQKRWDRAEARLARHLNGRFSAR